MFLPIIFSAVTFISTFLGGLFGLKYKDKQHLILGFTAGVLLGIVSFDIFPEIIKQITQTGIDPIQPMIALVIGFLAFHIVEKLLLIHSLDEEHYSEHKHPKVGVLSALALSGHSFIDGVGIGLGFQVSPSVGLFVAIAVVAHDFSDGLNTVSLMLAHKNSQKLSLQFLFLDALAPVLGVISTFIIQIPENFLVYYLGIFAGFLLYIGASDVLPEAHSTHRSNLTVVLTVLGVVFIYTIIKVSGG